MVVVGLSGRRVGQYLSEAFCLGVLLEAKGWEVHAASEDFRFGEDTDASYSVNFHFHVWITVGIAQIGQMRSPSRVLCVSLDNDCILV